MARAIVIAAALICVAAGSSQAQIRTTGAEADPVVAVINGENIHHSAIEFFHRTLPDQYRWMPLDALYDRLLDSLIDRKISAQAARDAGLTEDRLVRMRVAMATEAVLQETYIVQRIEEAITEERLQAAYQRAIAELPPRDEVRARHILSKTEPDAREVILELERGADFAELARQRSTGPTASVGGDLGFFTEDAMVPEFAQAAFALKVGATTTEPVQTPFGWHVILIVDRRRGPPQSFESMADRLRDEEARQVAQDVMRSLRTKAHIELYNRDGSPRQ